MAKITASHYVAVETRGDFCFAYVPGYGTIEEARRNIAGRNGGNWKINRVDGHYRKNGTWKRDAETTIEVIR
jgi:hypothetical protein